MRHVLLRFLLLAMFFNMAIGMPMHEAKHLLRSEGSAAQQTFWAEDVMEDVQSSNETKRSHGMCAWCLAYAQHATATALPVLLALPVKPVIRVGIQSDARFIAAPLRWPFAARDPPAST
jgi:hypothetical protein